MSQKAKRLKDEKIDDRQELEVGFIVYRIKTGIKLQDFREFIFSDTSEDQKQYSALIELKLALLELNNFLYNENNQDYNPNDNSRNFKSGDFKKLYDNGLPKGMGIYAQLFKKNI